MHRHIIRFAQHATGDIGEITLEGNGAYKAMNEINNNQEKLLRIEQAEADIEDKVFHRGFEDAKLLIELRDRENYLHEALRYEREIQANEVK